MQVTQAQADSPTRPSSSPAPAAFPAPLAGKLRDETGDRLTPTHTIKSGRRICYYSSHRPITEPTDRLGLRLPAAQLERIVARIMAQHLERTEEGHALLAEPDALSADA